MCSHLVTLINVEDKEFNNSQNSQLPVTLNVMLSTEGTKMTLYTKVISIKHTSEAYLKEIIIVYKKSTLSLWY